MDAVGVVDPGNGHVLDSRVILLVQICKILKKFIRLLGIVGRHAVEYGSEGVGGAVSQSCRTGGTTDHGNVVLQRRVSHCRRASAVVGAGNHGHALVQKLAGLRRRLIRVGLVIRKHDLHLLAAQDALVLRQLPIKIVGIVDDILRDLHGRFQILTCR